MIDRNVIACKRFGRIQVDNYQTIGSFENSDEGSSPDEPFWFKTKIPKVRLKDLLSVWFVRDEPSYRAD
jgi:hypothetical protein